MGHNRRPAAADILCHGGADAVDLSVTGLAAQLQRRFSQLVEAGGTDRVAACLEAAHGADGNTAVGQNIPILGQPYPLAGFGKPACF